MSDQNTATDQTVTTPNAGAVTQAAVTEATPPPFAVFPDAKSFSQRVSRETRKLMNDSAKQAGFDDWAHMQEAVGALRQTPAASTTPATVAPAATQDAQATIDAHASSDEAKRLRMAIQAGTKLNLPTALVLRLQGTTVEEMEADATSLLGLMTTPRGPGIPSVPTQNKPATFTRAQLQDPKFVREHTQEILQASREGRIVDS